MKRFGTVAGPRAVSLLALFATAAFPLAGLAADDEQAERESRRLENEIRRQDAQARREIEDRNRVQAEALRSQEAAISRMEATQARMLADSQERERQSSEQSRIYFYPYYPDRPSSTPGAQSEPIPQITPIPASPGVSPAVPDVPVVGNRSRNDPVSRINFASTQSGVLIVSAGGGALFGLQGGDLILSIDGRVPVDGAHAALILRSYRPGEPVKLRVQRDRRVMELVTTAP
jgi:hypothetical protein